MPQAPFANNPSRFAFDGVADAALLQSNIEPTRGLEMSHPISIPVSPGELFDKKTILEIKKQRIADVGKLALIDHELALLSAVARDVLAGTARASEIEVLEHELLAVNQRLWDIENAVRASERASRFDAAFIEAARQVYLNNDHRADLKYRINLLLESPLVEVKEHL